MHLEVVAELPRGDEDRVEQLLNLRVPLQGVPKDLADKVHRSLHHTGRRGLIPGAAVYLVVMLQWSPCGGFATRGMLLAFHH